MSWRTLRLLGVCAVAAVSAAAACGGNASDPGTGSAPNTAGSAGHAGASTSVGGSTSRAGAGTTTTDPAPVSCGAKMCAGLSTPIEGFSVPACCADEDTAHCGLDSSVLASFGAVFPEACQPLAQPGTADASCPASAKTPVQGFDIQLPGCCRADHTCGYQLDTVGGFLRVGLGCIDSAPFLDGATPPSCGGDGAAGAAGAGGDSGVSGSAGAAGDSSGLGGSSNSTAGDAGSSGAAG